ncbi:DUF1168-domain-containing protein [Acrodontium crateriforme]|uniref:DUF1168-domain-containing protein n=1 Tax=Acrodontium crateriforme TaxID=150365 RepID=A0AAQ3R9A5_9PEZI|nr:DUF1168-domain-containing protein [Acrodontium crateriforme]
MAPKSEFIPTNMDKRSDRPTKKRAITPVSQQSAQVEALFANPDREIHIPSSSTDLAKANASQSGSAPSAIVTNVQGSSAGAGSGEFHVYKASRRREYERLRAMDEEVEKEKADAEFNERREELRKKDEEQAAKNRAKREKAKARQAKKKMGGNGPSKEATDGAKTGIKKLGAAKIAQQGRDQGNDKDGDATTNQPATGSEPGEEVSEGITFHDDD